MKNLAEKGILTLAIGKKFHVQAKYLAYSCILHSPSLPRAIITDNCEYFKELYDVTIEYTADMGDPFNAKLKLHHYSPFLKTLFLDADTLVYRDLHFLWDFFGEQSIVYQGTCGKEGNWYFKEIADVLKYYNVPWIGKLNSGVFLFKKDEVGINVMNYAVELRENHEDVSKPLPMEVTLPKWRGKMLPDEPFLAIAFGKYGQMPTNDFGRMGRSLIEIKNVKLDITKGISRYIKDGNAVFPAVVHFVGGKKTYYFEEKMKLLFYYKGIPCGMCIFFWSVYMISRFLIFLTFIKRCIKHFVKR